MKILKESSRQSGNPATKELRFELRTSVSHPKGQEKLSSTELQKANKLVQRKSATKAYWLLAGNQVSRYPMGTPELVESKGEISSPNRTIKERE